jgi:segregation and condensation protein B
VTDDPTDLRTTPAPRRRLGLPGQVRPGEQLETVFRDDVPETDAVLLPDYPATREHAAAAGEWLPAAEPLPAVQPVLPAEVTEAAEAVPEAPMAPVSTTVPAARGDVPAEAPAAPPDAEADEGSDPVAEIPLKAALEAVLMVVDEPTTAARLAEVLERPKKLVAAALAELAQEYDAQQRGFELRYVAGGWRFYTRAVCAPVVDRFVLDGQQARLTQAALETLAVIAYRQPVSRSRVSAVRGVNCDGVMRTLVQRGLVEESGTEPETGAYLYRTTHYFLERMGLRGLEELPELAPFLPEADDVEADSQEGSAIAEAVAAAD